MCYDIKTSKKAQLERVRRAQDLLALEEIEDRLLPLTDLPLHHASGFKAGKSHHQSRWHFVFVRF